MGEGEAVTWGQDLCRFDPGFPIVSPKLQFLLNWRPYKKKLKVNNKKDLAI